MAVKLGMSSWGMDSGAGSGDPQALRGLPPFDRGKACVKCGSIGARVEYRQWSRHDCLKRTCSECGYSWDEAPLDACSWHTSDCAYPHADGEPCPRPGISGGPCADATNQGDRNSDQSPEAQGDGE